MKNRICLFLALICMLSTASCNCFSCNSTAVTKADSTAQDTSITDSIKVYTIIDNNGEHLAISYTIAPTTKDITYTYPSGSIDKAKNYIIDSTFISSSSVLWDTNNLKGVIITAPKPTYIKQGKH